MKRKTKILSTLAFLFIFCFLAAGYAAITDNLTVSGSINLEAPNEVYITSVTHAGASSGSTGTVNSYTSTLLNSTVNLTSASSSYVTFSITVYNGTNFTAYYQNTLYSEAAYDNENIVCTTSLATNAPVQSKHSLTFTATFEYKNGISVSNTTLNSLVNFKFSDELTQEEQAVDEALGRFDDILNNETELGKTFELLRDEMTSGDGLSGRNDTYIGNVIGSANSDSAAINKLFTDAEGNNKLVLEIDGVQTAVTVMVKYEDITGDGVADMTIYMTPDKISGSIWNRPKVTVYAAVFTSTTLTGTDGTTITNWSMLGQLFKGTATTNAYSGNVFGASDSFNTDTWRSSEAYNGIASNSTIERVLAGL